MIKKYNSKLQNNKSRVLYIIMKLYTVTCDQFCQYETVLDEIELNNSPTSGESSTVIKEQSVEKVYNRERNHLPDCK